MEYKNPLVVTLSDTPSTRSAEHPNVFQINAKQSWNTFKKELHRAAELSEGFDYIALSYTDSLVNGDDVSRKSLDIMSNEVAKVGTNYSVPVINRFDGQIYQLNPAYGEGVEYMPDNATVVSKYEQFDNNDDWQKHQSDVWSKFAEINTLKDGSYGPDHKGLLTSNSRGLTEKDLDGFFSLSPHKVIIPSLVNDDMVGMPGIKAIKNDDSYFYGDKFVGQGALSLSSMGSGYAIPMRNKNGDMAKFQIGADVSKYNFTLKARTEHGVSIQNSEIYNKKERKYTLKLTDGSNSELKVVRADNNGATLSDIKGEFEVSIKQDVKPLLIERGYDVPEIIDTLHAQPSAKYNWPAPGNMVGVAEKGGLDVPKLVSPSEPGFIPVREPKTPDAGYTLLVVEGALKGHIVATYLQKDNLSEVTDAIAQNGQGLVVSQVPGVIRKFIEGTQSIYDTYDIRDSVVAMDADGRYNRSVAQGIKDAEEILSQHGPTRVMSWNPDQKGLDDALIAIGRNEIGLGEFGMTFGTADELFPLHQAERPNPYKLDGTRANRQEWPEEYEKKKLHSQEVKTKIMEESKELDEKLSMHDSAKEAPILPLLEKPQSVPKVYTIDQTDLDRISEKHEQGEISAEDMQDFLQSVSDLTKSLHDQLSNFAK